MTINCIDVIDQIKSDFGKLWSCKKLGETLAVSTPYLLPNDEALTIYLTIRDNRFIVTDGGYLEKYLAKEDCILPKAKISKVIGHFSDRHNISVLELPSKYQCYYKATRDLKIIPALIFDLGNYVISVCHAAQNHSLVDGKTYEKFTTKAKDYVKDVVKSLPVNRYTREKLEQLPHIKFKEVITSGSHYWLMDYITGNTAGEFAHNLSHAVVNCMIVRRDPVCEKSTFVTMVNDQAPGYKYSVIESRIAELKAVTEMQPLTWSDRSRLSNILVDEGPKLKRWTERSPHG